jgi:hypothetical protein
MLAAATGHTLRQRAAVAAAIRARLPAATLEYAATIFDAERQSPNQKGALAK